MGIKLLLSASGALLGSNPPPRNSRLETYRNWPTLGGCQGVISSSIGVDLPIPQKPTLATARRWLIGRAISLRNEIQLKAAVAIRSASRQQHGVALAPWTE